MATDSRAERSADAVAERVRAQDVTLDHNQRNARVNLAPMPGHKALSAQHWHTSCTTRSRRSTHALPIAGVTRLRRASLSGLGLILEILQNSAEFRGIIPGLFDLDQSRSARAKIPGLFLGLLVCSFYSCFFSRSVGIIPWSARSLHQRAGIVRSLHP